MKFGLSKPVVARYVATKKYADGFVCGEAMTTEVTPNYAEGKLYGDNKMVRSRKKFTNASVKMNTTTLPLIAESVMFGHTVSMDGTEVLKTNDENSYVGYGFISKEERDEKTVYIACVLHKVIFSESANNYQTEGESITFNTPSVSGVAMGDDKEEWLTRKPFDTENEAYEWITGFLGITDKCATPTASVPAGTYEAAQSVTLSVTDGGCIYYTTDGTTPSKSNGTKATAAAIAVTKTTMLRAINTAAGKTDSDILSAEYVITEA